MALERTQIGSPLYGVSVKRNQVSQDSRLSAFASMANLGSAVSKIVADEQEAQSVMDAQNDLVNDAINPDKLQHQAAYAWTVADGDALASYNTISESIQNGEYDEMDPNDFQSMLRKSHKEYYKKWDGNNHSEGAIKAYNEFMLKNQSRLTAAQAGKYRLDQKDKQSNALSTRITEMAKSKLSSLIDFQAEIESDKYSLLAPEDRLRTILTGIGTYAKETGDVSILEELDKEYGLSSNPALHLQFEGDMTAANRKRMAVSDVATLKQLTILDGFVEQGTLTEKMYEPISQMKDIRGNAIMSPEQFNTLLRKSAINRAKMQTMSQYEVGFRTGVDLNNAKQADFNSTVQKEFDAILRQTGDKLVAFQKIGELLAQQTNVWTDLQDRSKLFDRTMMLIGNAPNKEAMGRFYELEALEAGMNTYTDGTKLFTKYLGDSYADYLEIKLAIERTSTTPDNAWTEVATSRELIGKTKKNGSVVSELGPVAMNIGREAAMDKWESSDKWYIPNFIENSGSVPDPLERVAVVGAMAYDQKIKEGRSPEIASRFAKAKAFSQTERWGGELFDTHGIGMKALLGTSDPDGAFNTVLEDPQFGSKINEMFGLTTKELFFGDYTMKDRLEREAGLFEDPSDPAVAERMNRKRSGVPKHTFVGNIRKSINIERGTLDFDSEEGDVIFSIPLKTIGDLHNAKLQGIEDIESLDRLYSPGFLSTDAGRLWHDQQADMNDKFSHEVLGTEKARGRTGFTVEEYNSMTQKGRTMIRKQFYKDNYSGAIGKLYQIADYFNLKRNVVEDANAGAVTLPMPSKEGSALDIAFTKKLIKDNEGLSLTPYKDGNGASVGYGHFIKDGESYDNITRERAEAIFERDFPQYLKAAQGIPGFNRASTRRKAALVDLTYNLGANWYKLWSETPRAIAMGDYNKAATLLENTMWYKQVGERGPKIVDMIRNG